MVVRASLTSIPSPARFGLAVIAIYLLLALLTPWIAPYLESEVVGHAYMPISIDHPLGTDSLGRDMLTRILYGGRNTLGIALSATLLTFLTGMVAGLFAAIIGGWPDQLLSRFVDVVMSVPQLIMKLFLLSVFGTSVPSLILIIAAVDSTRVFRLVRATASDVAVMDFVEAARVRGEGLGWIMTREVLPNITAPLIAEFGLRFCFVFLAISALSFLGLGIQPPMADWGQMVRENAILITFGNVTPLIPATAIALLTISVNFVVDWMLQRSSGVAE
ncbi:ABC transporter permease [Oricola sp.]|uniref:ABC transporter permease n=1 Tax=Oricola sp. TaxID=1979950 RepID=UPI0025DBD5B6|nr:ABC transporter permease [Oricola sp.]MCI5076890.1 ABC transporter permease [Oricola sp.]